jgi:hypothetical protein
MRNRGREKGGWKRGEKEGERGRGGRIDFSNDIPKMFPQNRYRTPNFFLNFLKMQIR